ncbi:hypothetical protein B6U70_02880 [Euryarchaeota archaeon ex4484_162]|nr:hypothetical protein [Thermoplasmata archaeon]OYT57016.1 MAG: hypothetical protein B6U70_02880 [Euryarchaeota archaeon ex4484_162]RLF31155.1 MAG: hypothetical protein DRJ99_00375 [Thermoplasmata archaeon]
MWDYYISLFLTVVMTGLSALLLMVSMVSSYRLRNVKLMLISIAFICFFIKGLILCLQMLLDFEIIRQNNIVLVFDLVVITALYFAAIKD